MPTEQAPTLLENLDSASSAIQNLAATLAIIFGALWAYFRFIKDRIYRPRLDMSIDPVVFVDGETANLVSRISVKNIGTSKVAINQEGSALTILRGASNADAYRTPVWTDRGSYEVFPEHQWIESGETIRYDVSVSIPKDRREVLSLRLRLLCTVRRKRIETNCRIVLPPGSEQEQGDGRDA